MLVSVVTYPNRPAPDISETGQVLVEGGGQNLPVELAHLEAHASFEPVVVVYVLVVLTRDAEHVIAH